MVETSDSFLQGGYTQRLFLVSRKIPASSMRGSLVDAAQSLWAPRRHEWIGVATRENWRVWIHARQIDSVPVLCLNGLEAR